MRIDYIYLQEVLSNILASNKTTFDLNDFRVYWDSKDKEDKFIFHMEILADQNFFANAIDTDGLGIT